MKTRLLSVLFLASLAVASCKEDEYEYVPSTVPTVPTSFSLEDGAVIESTEVQLSASGSTVEDENLAISYDYYIGTSMDNMQKTEPDVKLEPYTQYFWYAQAKTEVSEGEKMDVRTFYCVPPFKIQTENGEDDWKAIWKWEYMDGDRDATLKLTADKEGYITQPTFTSDMTSLEITLADYDAYTHWWDDEHGVYYEPIIYTLELSFTRKVGDKDLIVKGQASEIILGGDNLIRDHEFNVYRLVTIGDQTWFADDLRVRSYIDENGNIIPLSEMTESPSKVYADYYVATNPYTGSKGVLYNKYLCKNGEMTKTKNVELLNRTFKGYHIAMLDDFKKLFQYYMGREIKDKKDYCYVIEKIGSKYDWAGINDFEQIGYFNAKPYGNVQDRKYYSVEYINSFNYSNGHIDFRTFDGYETYDVDGDYMYFSEDNMYGSHALIRFIKD